MPSSIDTVLYEVIAATQKVRPGADGFTVKPIHLANVSSPVVTLDNTGTPSVITTQRFKTGGTADITTFDDGVEGQFIQVLLKHSVDFTNGAGLVLKNGIDFITGQSGDVICFIAFEGDGTTWYEVSRSINHV
jgi:hypothetical protein